MEFLQTIDYSQVVAICTSCIAAALPIGIIFGIAGKAVNFFLSMVFGKERVDL